MFLTDVCQTLATKKVRYAVVGGYAVALHGAVRGTVDIDIVVPWTLKALGAAEEALRELGLESRLPVGAEEVFQFRDEYVANRNLVAWNFYKPCNPAEQVDIIITYDLRGKKRLRVDTAEGPIQILSLKDLLEMKRQSGRAQDLEDVRALESLS